MHLFSFHFFSIEKWQLDEDKLTFIILAPTNLASEFLTAAPPLDELFHTSSGPGLSPNDKRLADDFQMIGDVNIFLNGAIPHPQPSSPQVHLTTSSGNSTVTVSSLHLSARESFIEEVKDSEEDIDSGGGDFQAEVEIMIAGTCVFYFCFYDMFPFFFSYLLYQNLLFAGKD